MLSRLSNVGCGSGEGGFSWRSCPVLRHRLIIDLWPVPAALQPPGGARKVGDGFEGVRVVERGAVEWYVVVGEFLL